MQTIDVHTHVVPGGLPFGHDDRFATLVTDGGTGQVFVDGRLFRTVTESSWNTAARIGDMDAQGVRMQVLSVMPELFSYWAEPQRAASFCTALNEAIAACVSVDSSRFAGLGVVPLQDLDASIRMLEHVRQLGLRGVEIGSNVNGVTTGSLSFLPFYEAAATLGLCVFVHAFHPPYWDCVGDPPMSAAVNFPPEIGTCMATVIANGIVERCDGLRLGSSHGGGTLLNHLPRMAAFWATDEERVERSASPFSSARRLWFDTLAYHADALEALVDVVGEDRIMVGSDYPFFGEPAGYVLDALEKQGRPLPDAHEASAMRFLGLSATDAARKGPTR